MQTQEVRVEHLNEVLRGEWSAVETYSRALERIANEPGSADLRQIAVEHREAAELLRERILSSGGVPAESPGIWGVWARAAEGTARLLGDAAALRALREGELHGIEDSEEALDDGELDPESAELILTVLLPRARSHVSILGRFLGEKQGETGPAAPDLI